MADIISAHKHAIRHRPEILASQSCGCFHCLAVFGPDEVVDWTDWPPGTPEDRRLELGATALCSRCGIDSVLGAASGYPINRAFLTEMRAHWFEES